MDELALPSPCLVILVGPAGVGKSTWAAANFEPGQIVSSDGLRGQVGEGPHDQAASADAFAVLDDIVTRRLRRGLTTVIDSLGMDAPTRARWLTLAERAAVPCVAAVFEVTAAVVRAQNRARAVPVPEAVVRNMLERWPSVAEAVAAEPFAQVMSIRPATRAAVGPLVPAAQTPASTTPASTTPASTTPASAVLASTTPASAVLASAVLASAVPATVAAPPTRRSLGFGLQIPRFEFPGGPAEIGPRLREIAVAAEAAGFDHLWVMDHFRQIPQVGRPWENMLDSWTTLSYLAGFTSTIRLGTMVTGITYRNIAHLAKIVATLDVLSGGRAICGLGAAWFKQEHEAYGWPFPATAERYAMLEDALELLPLIWGPGSARFEGRTITVPEAMCYPRPLQAKIPLLVGGSGEQRTLRLVARYADACNLFGDEETVARKRSVLAGHCASVGRPIDDIEVTHLSTVLVGDDLAHTRNLVDRLRPQRVGSERFARSVNAGSIEQHVERIDRFVAAGAHTMIVSLADIGVEAVERYGRVITATRAAHAAR